MDELPEVASLRGQASALAGNVSGVYFLFDGDELVYVGEGWNCFLRVAEHTRKESTKTFTHWSFVSVESPTERKSIERRIRALRRPPFNKV